MISTSLRKILPRYTALADWKQASEFARDVRDMVVAFLSGVDSLESRIETLERQPRGEIYILDNGTSLALTTQNTWYQVVTGWVVGESVDTTALAAGTIRIDVSTAVRVIVTMSFYYNFVQVYEFAVFVDGAQVTKSRQKTDATLACQNMTLSCVIDAKAGQVLSLWARSTSAGAGRTVVMRDVNFSVTRI